MRNPGTPPLITVFGGGGFIGRYVCEALLKARARLRVAERFPRKAWFLQPLGGSFKTVGSVELIFPTPFTKADSDTAQFSAFFDVGNVFADYDAFKTDELRASTGLSFKWQAPVGPIIINLVAPLKKKDGDRTETIQFSFGNQF